MARADRWLTILLVGAWLVGASAAAHAQSTGGPGGGPTGGTTGGSTTGGTNGGTTGSNTGGITGGITNGSTGGGTGSNTGLANGSTTTGVPELNATNVGMPLCLIGGALLVASERRREQA